MEYDMKSYEISKQFVDVNWELYCNWIGERITLYSWNMIPDIMEYIYYPIISTIIVHIMDM